MKPLSLFLILLVIYSCSTPSQLPRSEDLPDFKADITAILSGDSTFTQSHSGLVVYDIEQDKEVFNHKGSQYFTPASNTKLLTFYTAYSVLGDRMIGMQYYETADSLIIWGTGDPTFLNEYFAKDIYITSFLKNARKPIYLSLSNYQDSKYGPGWSWEDFYYQYQCDKSGFPIYGNMLTINKKEENAGMDVYPEYFAKYILPSMESQRFMFMREMDENFIHADFNNINERVSFDYKFPFRADDVTIASLLSNHIGKPVTLINESGHRADRINFYSVPMQKIYKEFLQPSDNFIGEQLLLNCGFYLFDTMNVRKTIDWAMDSLLMDMPHKFQWVDGSGLSRYNLTTPENTIHLLKLIYHKVPQELLFEWLPTGGESGTIRNWYKGEQPFIHAKTGTLRNNHALSGYLVADSGKIYAFSFLNSNFVNSTNEIRRGMDKILRILKAEL